MDTFLTEEETAKLLKIKRFTLSKLRREGKGPSHLRIGGSIRYNIKDVLAWTEQQRRIS
jgi:excisionase family DNA binding protein